MIEMYHGETTIKVLPHKVAEMERKGWLIAGEEPVEQIDIDSEEEFEDGDS